MICSNKPKEYDHYGHVGLYLKKKLYLHHHKVLVQLSTFDIVEDLVEFGALAIT